MHIDIQASNTRFSREHSLEIAQRLRAAFAMLAHNIVRIVVRVSEVARSGSSTRECVVEVHFPNGEIATVNERQRKLGALVRRATERSRKAVAALISHQRVPLKPAPLPSMGKGLAT